MAANPQCPIRYPDRSAYFRDIKRLVGALLHQSAKPTHDQVMMLLSQPLSANLLGTEAGNHGLNERLLETRVLPRDRR